jgi:spore maturation protein CgeB
MKKARPPIVFIGLSITSSWGNGHATTYRALLKALHALGEEVVFLERDVPWYAANRDALAPGYRVELYDSVVDLSNRFGGLVAAARAVIVGSYVPDGADVLRWALETAGGLCLFYDIDTPVTLAQLAASQPTYIAPESIPRLDAYLSFTGGPVLDRLERELGARKALPLYCSVDPALYQPQPCAREHDLGYLGTYSKDRQPKLELLLAEPARRWPKGSFVVAGPGYPEDAWPANVKRVDHVAPHDHARFYCGLRFTLNVTRQDMVQAGHSPSVRLFEAAACGVPIISDAWAGLDELFVPGEEIVTAETAEQVLDCVLRMPDQRRRAIGERGRARVLAEHTATHRASALLQYLEQLPARRKSAA